MIIFQFSKRWGRLNNKTYYKMNFVKKNGIKHHELYFADGSVPSVDIVKQFFGDCGID